MKHTRMTDVLFGRAAPMLLALAALGLCTNAPEATVTDIDFSEVPLFTADPVIEGTAFYAGDPNNFEDTFTDDFNNPGDPYLVAGYDESGPVDIPGFTQTSFIGVDMGAALGGTGLLTEISVGAAFFQPTPGGEALRMEALLGGVLQQFVEISTDALVPDFQTLGISLDEIAFDALYIYVPADGGADFAIDNLLVDVTQKTTPPVPVPGTLLLMGAGMMGMRRLAKRGSSH